MTDKWRLIVEDTEDPVFHLASLEAVWRAFDEGPAPATVVMRRLSPCVLIGSSQEAAREVDLAECRRRDLPVVRRPSEGGAIYCDRDCLLFSVVCRRDARSAAGPAEALALWGGLIVKALGRMGVAGEACFARPNDILVGGRKVAGLTLTDWYGIRAFSGALLVDADLETMAAVLRPGPDKLGRHGAASLAERVTTLRRCGKATLTPEEGIAALAATIAQERGVRLEREPLSAWEMEEAVPLRKHKYGHPGWNRTEPALEAV